MKTLLVLWTAYLILSSTPIQAGLLPGGIINPALSTAAMVNPSVLSQDWETNLCLLYAPPSDATIPHRYLTSFTYAKPEGYGVSAGYNGSSYEGTGLHSGFLGGGYSAGALSFGASADFPDMGTGFVPRFNLGTAWKHGERRRYGIVAYDVSGNLRLSAGAGLVYQRRYSIEANLLSPGFKERNSIQDQLAISLAGSYYWWQGIGVSLGTRYWMGLTGERYFTWNAGAVLTINERVVLTAQYNSQPEAVMVGAMLGYFPDGGDRQEHVQTNRMKRIAK